MPLPDYTSAGLVNLVQSLARGLGLPPHPDYPPAALLPPAEVAAARQVILLVVDGLGSLFLQRHPDSFLARHARGSLTSVFPTTTASAVTSLATGVGPQQHAITGWFVWLRELGLTSVILPYRVRGAGPGAAPALPPAAVIGAPSWHARLAVERAWVSESAIVDSAYSRALAAAAPRFGYRELAGLFERLLELARREAPPRYLHAYWAGLDACAHRHGTDHAETRALYAELDAGIEALASALAGSGTLLLVTADHGFIDTVPERHLSLAAHPELRRLLALPLSGEPRAAYAHVRAGQAAAFERRVAESLGDWCELHPAQDIIGAGWFGRGAPHPALPMKDNRVIRDPLPGEEPVFFAGIHGGLTEAELRVPLVVIET